MNAYTLVSKAASIRVPLPGDYVVDGDGVTVTVTDKDATEIEGATATAQTYSLASDATAEDDESLTMAAWSARVFAPGDEYVMAHATAPDEHPTEHIIVSKVDGVTVYLTKPLENDWASTTTTIAPTWIDVAITADGIGDSYTRMNKIVCEFTALGTGDVVTTSRLFDIVAHIPRNPVTVGRLAQENPGLLAALESYFRGKGETVERAIDRAFLNVLRDIYTEVKPDLIQSDDQYVPAVVNRIAMYLADSGRVPHDGWDPADYYQAKKDDYADAITALTSCVEAVDVDQDGAIEGDEVNVSVRPRIVFSL